MADDGRAARYHRIQLALAVAALALSALYLTLLLASDASHAVARWVAAHLTPWWAQVALVAVMVGLGHRLVITPLSFIRGYWLPRRFGLLHQSLAGWLGDRAKAMLLGAVFGLAVLELIYGLLRTTLLWWLIAAAAVVVASVGITAVLPVWILPLFYRQTRLVDAELERRLLALAERAGVPAIGVWVVDQSRKSRTANAAVVGLGRTRRIILFDTLTANFTPEEIEAVLAHELGHHVRGDLRRSLIAQAAITLAVFAAGDIVYRAGLGIFSLDGPADPAGLPWLALVLGALSLVLVPLGNTYSRWIERQADDFALAMTRNPQAFVSAMERLASLNLAERRPHRLKEIVLYSHPSLERRIARARGAAA